jgi:chemotaxis protein methyltransferase CheR
MPLYAETLGLSGNAFILLRDLIHERLGLFYDDNKRDLLADKLSPLVVERGFDTFVDYYYLLKYDEGANEEWQRVMEALSVQETYFWRELGQIRALVDHLVPQEFAPQSRPLHIWSAACATGEEPLTIAIALNEAGWFDRLPIEIVASDASQSALQKAQRGHYRQRAFRALPLHLRERYFTEDESGYQIVPEIHQRVRWQSANLMNEADVARLACVPVIFCRNAFIYFSPATVRQTVQRFYKRMPAPGYLFVGVAESLMRLNIDFQLREIGDAFAYVKEAPPRSMNE